MTHQHRNWIFGAIPSAATPALALAILLALTVVTPQSAQAQTYNVIYNFTGGADGASPLAGLTMDAAGALYGTASAGGSGQGTVFKLTHNSSTWVVRPLYSFTGGNDGSQPRARVIFGPDGALYGTTTAGAGLGCNGSGCGVVFNLKPPTACKTALCAWTQTVLYRFSGGRDGGDSNSEVIFDRTGNIYGTTVLGGQDCFFRGCGVVYKLTHSGSGWTESVLYIFGLGVNGAYPVGSLVFDSAGNLYGTTYGYTDGLYAPYGTIFELTPSGSGWMQKTLYTFQDGSDGGSPNAGLIIDNSAILYGATTTGGAAGGGTVFDLSPSGGNWSFTTLYGLTGSGPLTGPDANLTMDAAGNLYGTTFADGTHGHGSVFKLTRATGWIYTSLHDFTGGSDGAYPNSNVTFDAGGSLYGTTTRGGTSSNCQGGCGVVFQITP